MPRCKNKNCKDKFVAKYFLQKYCMKKDECIKAFSDEVKEINLNEKISVMKEGLKTLSSYKKDLQVEINTIIRLIDEGQPCIARNSMIGKRNAGHYWSVGSNDTIRYHLDNIHIQSEYSNSFKSGDTLNYQIGIDKTYGSEYLAHMNGLKSTPVIKLSIPVIKEKILICRQIVKELKNANTVYYPSERLSLRKEFNKRIGIYVVC